jgi:hypothetical protein
VRDRHVLLLRWLALTLVGVATAVSVVEVVWPDSVWSFPTDWWPYRRPWWWPWRAQRHAYPLSSVLLFVAGVGVCGWLSWVAAQLRARTIALVLLGAVALVQTGALLEPGHGPWPYAERVAKTSRSEFFVRAALADDAFAVLWHYDYSLDDGQPKLFSSVKNPGNFLMHWSVHRAAQLPGFSHALDAMVADEPDFDDRLYKRLTKKWKGRFTALDPSMKTELRRGMLFMPFATAVVRCALPPLLFLLCLPLLPRREALWIALASIAMPMLRLEHMRPAGSVFPLLFAGAVLAWWLALKSRRHGWAVAAGAATAANVYISFGGLSTGFLIGAHAVLVAAAALYLRRLDEERDPDGLALVHAWRTPVIACAAYGVSFFACLGVLRAVLGFRSIDRLRTTLALHEDFRGGGTPLEWFALNTVEFFGSLGPLVWGPAAVGLVLSAVALVRRRGLDRAHLLTLALLPLWFSLNRDTGSAEVHRLWAFLTPIVLFPALAGARWLGLLADRRWMTGYVVALLLWLAVTSTGWSTYGMHL